LKIIIGKNVATGGYREWENSGFLNCIPAARIQQNGEIKNFFMNEFDFDVLNVKK
jgi:hypothetical protein